MTHIEFLQYLSAQEYTHIKLVDEKNYIAIVKQIFNYKIIRGAMGDMMGFDDEWYYESLENAVKAIRAWNGNGEPTGWAPHLDKIY